MGFWDPPEREIKIGAGPFTFSNNTVALKIIRGTGRLIRYCLYNGAEYTKNLIQEKKYDD